MPLLGPLQALRAEPKPLPTSIGIYSLLLYHPLQFLGIALVLAEHTPTVRLAV